MLFLKELKKTMFSVSYVLFTAVLVLALHSQGALDFSGDLMTEPEPGGSYGMTNKEIPQIIMPAALRQLWSEFCVNNYKTYPMGFLKNIRLDEDEQDKIAEIIADISGVEKEKVLSTAKLQKEDQNENPDQNQKDGAGAEFEIGGDIRPDADGEFVFHAPENADGGQDPADSPDAFDPAVRRDLDYGHFKQRMQEVDDLLGGGSDYEAESLAGFGSVPLSYAEAVQKYDLAVDRDKVTGGYARLFSDYALAMVMSVLPVFLAVILCLNDRRAKMTELIYVREVSALKLTAARFCAVTAAAMLPVVILSYVSNASVWGCYPDIRLDYLAPLKYDMGWILPGVMTAAALGMFLTELTGTPIAAAVQGIWWLFDINQGMRSADRAYALFRLVPRHNAGPDSYFRTEDFADHFSRLLANRLLAAGLAVLLLAAAAWIYHKKRKGKLNGIYTVKKRAVSGFRSRKNKSAA